MDKRDWPAYGGDLSNTRYSALDQINTQNITKLSQAWVYDTASHRAAPKRIVPRKRRLWW